MPLLTTTSRMVPHYFCLVLLSACLFIACDDEEDVVDYIPINCANEMSAVEVFSGTSCDDASFDANVFCEVQEYGTYTLELESKDFAFHHCQPLGANIRYVNSTGQEKTLQLVTSQFLTNSRVTYNSFLACPEDANLTIGYCINTERVLTTLCVVNENDCFNLDISTRLEFPQRGIVGAGDYMTISTGGTLALGILLAAKDDAIEQPDGQEFYDEIVLLDKTFANVFSSDRTIVASEAFKCYYSKEEGLVAFRDEDGVLWIRQ